MREKRNEGKEEEWKAERKRKRKKERERNKEEKEERREKINNKRTNKQRKKRREERWRVSIGTLNWDCYWDDAGQWGFLFVKNLERHHYMEFKTLVATILILYETSRNLNFFPCKSCITYYILIDLD